MDLQEVPEDVSDRRLATARAWVRACHIPGNAFGDPTLFLNPAWSMLLELYALDSADRPLSVGAICVASGAPTTTALRYLDTLEQRGFVVRAADTNDRRRILVFLTERGRSSMEVALDRAIASDRKLGLDRLRLIK